MTITRKAFAGAAFLFALCTVNLVAKDDSFNRVIKTAGTQLEIQAAAYDTLNYFPRSFENGKYRVSSHRDWTCGFFPGTLWLEYELTGDGKFKALAEKYSERIKDCTCKKGTHDLGFITFCSYGNAYRLTRDTAAAGVIVNSARTLALRFDPKVGLIRSWDFGKWNYPVIIDNMMNLEMLFWASEYTSDKSLRDIAVSHADKTMANHFRSDYSSYHVVSYNNDGTVQSKGTHQGYADESAWSRGQAWGLYGYLICYRYTKDAKYLDMAEHIAAYIMNNPAMPKDNIPYWDYSLPEGYSPMARDASAAAVTASALIEMSRVAAPEKSALYLKYAKSIIKSLCSPEYFAKPGTNGGFILKHSTGAASLNSEIDVAINYADYYLLEAIARLKNLQ